MACQSWIDFFPSWKCVSGAEKTHIQFLASLSEFLNPARITMSNLPSIPKADHSKFLIIQPFQLFQNNNHQVINNLQKFMRQFSSP